MSYSDLLAAATALANDPAAAKYVHKQMVSISYKDQKDVNVNDLLSDTALATMTNYIGTICDLNAYILMCMATSLERVEAMKTQVNSFTNKDNPTVGTWYDTDNSDHIHVLKKGGGASFLKLMTTWASIEQNTGIVQIKMARDGLPHTFVIERYQKAVQNSATGVTRFRVYQGYENVYRLKDHMGLANDTSSYMCGVADIRSNNPTSTGTLWPLSGIKLEASPKDAQAYQKLLENKHYPSITADYERFLAMRTRNGHCTSLTDAELFQLVLQPISDLMSGGLTANDYGLVSGSPAKNDPKKNHTSPWLVLLMSDNVTPASFNTYQSIVDRYEEMTLYVTIPLSE